MLNSRSGWQQSPFFYGIRSKRKKVLPGEVYSGKTTLAGTILYESQDARDSVLKSGMESGVAASYDRLEEMVSEIST